MSISSSFIAEYKPWLIGSVMLHVVVMLAFALTTFTIPRQLPQQLAVQATLVDETKTKSAKEAVAREQREARERKAVQARRERDKQRQQQAEQERKAKAQRERKMKAEQQRKQTAERERKLKRQQEQQAIAAREAQEKAAVESERQAKLAAERKAQAEAERQARIKAERKAKADAERKSAEAAAAARQAELMASMEAEERLLAARSSDEMAQYAALIKQKVERNWAIPAGSPAGIECEVFVSQIPGGEVVGVKVGRCNADSAVVRSLEAAVFKSSPLPLPSNPLLFDRTLRLTFKPPG